MAPSLGDLPTNADMTGMAPRTRRELTDTQAELDTLLSGDWINED